MYFRTQLSISYVDVGMFILEEIWKKHGGLIRSAQYESSLPYLQHVSVSFRATVTTETSVIFSIGNCYIAILITFSDKHSCDFFFHSCYCTKRSGAMTFKILLTIQTLNTINWIFKTKQMKNCWAHSWIVCAKTVQKMNSWIGHNKQSVVAWVMACYIKADRKCALIRISLSLASEHLSMTCCCSGEIYR